MNRQPWSEIIRQADAIPGWMTPDELQWLVHTAAALEPGSVWIELGTYIGRSFFAVALALPPAAHLYAIDHTLGQHTVSGRTFFDTLVAVARYRPDLHLHCLRETKQRAAPQLRSVRAAVVFDDAGHTYPVMRDSIPAWLPIVSAAGLLCGHDYNPRDWPGIVQAVDERLPQRSLPAGSIWSYRKP